ncbi:MAG: polyprenyl synthetase family protein [Candidatus Hydrothermarchaeaceae archaeon]
MEELWNRINDVNGDFRKDMDFAEGEIERCISDSHPSKLYNASRHFIKTGGKRVRPALVILSYGAVNENKETDYEHITPIAIAVELIHAATIIHDDIIDRSSMRRGVETVSAKWGNDTALVAGDLIFSKAFGIVGMHEKGELSGIISNACIRLAEGEALEMLHTGDLSMTEEVYLEVVERKTATLFEACTKCGAILGEGSEKEISALSKYGYHLGIGFQMTDDILDIVAKERTLGKPVGADISMGRPTFVILHALEVADKKDKKELVSILKSRVESNTDIKRALEIIKNTNSIEHASMRAKSQMETAKKELGHLKDTESKRALEIIAEYAVDRNF